MMFVSFFFFPQNKCLEEIARTILNENSLPKTFWADAINIDCYVMNKALIRPILIKTPYEFYFGTKLNISHFIYLVVYLLYIIMVKKT